MRIINYVKISEKISSSGQPSEDDFNHIAQMGFKTVVNLAMPTSENAIPHEGDIVTGLGMTYVHIPILWQKPTQEQFRLFVALMQQQRGDKIWVHCAMNMRVSVVLYLYNTLYLDMPETIAQQKLNAVWQPNEVWLRFIEQVKSASNSHEDKNRCHTV